MSDVFLSKRILKKKLAYVFSAWGVMSPMSPIRKSINEAIEKSVAADVAPVVHGRWILERDPAGKPVCYHCSACDSDGCHTSIRIAYKYCPNCGAKMDGTVS